jgi:phosphoribosylanthranilate isomerase
MALSRFHSLPDHSPFIKICGLTDPDNAQACVRAGADIIGLVFYPKSPRHLDIPRAAQVAQTISGQVPVWGVFVNAGLDTIMAHVEKCGLTGVQLHGRESPDLVDALKKKNLTVAKAVFAAGAPDLDTVHTYAAADCFLVECGLGKLPGGNARTWEYRRARKIAAQYPVLLAGGLTCNNITKALADADPLGVDISSGVETGFGFKDIQQVTELVRMVKRPGSRR